MHGEIKRIEVVGSYSQPDFKHWWKLSINGVIVDLYFIDDSPRIVVTDGKYFIVDPTSTKSIKLNGGEIYYVTSKVTA